MLSVRLGGSSIYFTASRHRVFVCFVAKDADEKEKWIFALENAISRRDFNHVCRFMIIIFWMRDLYSQLVL